MRFVLIKQMFQSVETYLMRVYLRGNARKFESSCFIDCFNNNVSTQGPKKAILLSKWRNHVVNPRGNGERFFSDESSRTRPVNLFLYLLWVVQKKLFILTSTLGTESLPFSRFSYVYETYVVYLHISIRTDPEKLDRISISSRPCQLQTSHYFLSVPGNIDQISTVTFLTFFKPRFCSPLCESRTDDDDDKDLKILLINGSSPSFCDRTEKEWFI